MIGPLKFNFRVSPLLNFTLSLFVYVWLVVLILTLGPVVAYPVHDWLLKVHSSMFTVHYSLFTIHCSLFTVHCSLIPALDHAFEVLIHD